MCRRVTRVRRNDPRAGAGARASRRWECPRAWCCRWPLLLADPLGDLLVGVLQGLTRVLAADDLGLGDRKSTRLNSSHVSISYAVFCLKTKKWSRSDT